MEGVGTVAMEASSYPSVPSSRANSMLSDPRSSVASTDSSFTHYSDASSRLSTASSRFSTASSRLSTVSNRSAPKNFACTFCGKALKSKPYWKSHEEEFHEQRFTWRCPDCEQIFHAGRRFREHHTKLHGCENCKQPRESGQLTTWKASPCVKKYEIVMHDKDAWGCGFCGCLLTTWEERCEHIAMHFEEKKSKWNFTNVILGLLKKPDIMESWDRMLAQRHGEQKNWPRFTWESKICNRLRYKLETKWDSRSFNIDKFVEEIYELAKIETGDVVKAAVETTPKLPEATDTTETVDYKIEPFDFRSNQRLHNLHGLLSEGALMDLDPVEPPQNLHQGLQQTKWPVSTDISQNTMTGTFGGYNASMTHMSTDFSRPVTQGFQPNWPNADFVSTPDLVDFPQSSYMSYSQAPKEVVTVPTSQYANFAQYPRQSVPPNFLHHSSSTDYRRFVPKQIRIGRYAQGIGEGGNMETEPRKESGAPTDVKSADEPKPVSAIVSSSTKGENAASDLEMESGSPVPSEELPEPHLFTVYQSMHGIDRQDVRKMLPKSWMWDVEFQNGHGIGGKDDGCWTCTPTEPDDPKNFPLTIAGAPVVLPVEYQWPPMAGVNPPPDPRPSAPIDCTAELPIEVIRDIFLTFEGSIGFYFLINSLLQIIVPEEFDMTWASSHLPHKYGGLKVCYINQTMEPTMLQLPSKTETVKSKSSHAASPGLANIFKSSKSSVPLLSPPLQLNDFIEAKPKSSLRKERFAGRIGLKVAKGDETCLLMSTHVITEAILSKSSLSGMLSRRDRFEKLDDDWNEHVEIWAGNEKIGTIKQTFDPEAEHYPTGFKYDLTLVRPTNPSALASVTSPVTSLGWLAHSSWASLRQRTSAVKILGPTESHRASKTLTSSCLSDVLVVGEGIFLAQAASKPVRERPLSAWKDLVSRAVLYRVYPDFDPPTGYSGVALYAEGTREDGTEGQGVVGLQSFVQRSGHVQSFEMEGGALEKRLKMGRVAFYGAFGVPEELKRDYTVV